MSQMSPLNPVTRHYPPPPPTMTQNEQKKWLTWVSDIESLRSGLHQVGDEVLVRLQLTHSPTSVVVAVDVVHVQNSKVLPDYLTVRRQVPIRLPFCPYSASDDS